MIRISNLRLLVGLVFALTGIRATANSYDFSFVFSSGTAVSGSFQGDLSGGLITNLTNITLSLPGGTPTPIALYGARFDSSAGAWVAGAIASFTLAENNFAFSDIDLSSGDPYSHLFFSVGDLGTYLETPYNAPFNLDSDSPLTGTWKLTDVTHAGSVPDGTSTATLLLGGFALLGLLRRSISV